MNPFNKSKFKNYTIPLLIFTFLFLFYKTNAQCNYSPVTASAYYLGDCKDYQYQVLEGSEIPVYGNNGVLYFSSILTSDIVISTTVASNSSSLNIFPNPAIYSIQLEYPFNTDGEIIIISSIGKEISRYKILANSISTIDVSGLPPGYYTILGQSTGHQLFTNKLIKQ